jgi:hypothetical protein
MTEIPRIHTIETAKRDCKYILWVADSEDYESHQTVRKSPQEGDSVTDILEENWDASGKSLPEPGDRTRSYKTDEKGITWVRWGDWVATRVESYPANIPGLQDYSEIVLCRCKYDPIPLEWSRVKRGVVTVDSFGGDVESFETWKRSQQAIEVDG